MAERPPPKKPAQTIRVSQEEIARHAPGPRRAFLTVIRSGQDLGVLAEVEGDATIGRNPDCTLTLQDLGVSWEHARVSRQKGDAYLLEDAGSTNGTRLNGSTLGQPGCLGDGDKIVMGDTVVRFSLADAMDVDFQTEVNMLVGTDALTGLESKRRFDDALDFALQVAEQSKDPLAVLMMDMDGVKPINDTHGHFFGAHVIGETGRLIANHLVEGGHACRFGGDEFSAFLPGLDKERACKAAETIRSAVENAGMEKDGIALAPTISIGVACFPDDGAAALELVDKADAALYRAKGEGKNRVCI